MQSSFNYEYIVKINTEKLPLQLTLSKSKGYENDGH